MKVEFMKEAEKKWKEWLTFHEKQKRRESKIHELSVSDG